MSGGRPLPTPPPASPSNYVFPPPTSRDPALKPNPHPYAVKTTTSGLLTRSNSSGYNTAATHHYYIPLSPNASRSPEHSRGHRPTKSQPIHASPTHSSPRPLPVPPGFSGSSPTRSGHVSGHEGSAHGYMSSDESPLPPPRRARRADTLPSFPSSEVAVHSTATPDDPPPNPKLWTPSQLSAYLVNALRAPSSAHPGEAQHALPLPVAKDIAAFLRSRVVSGRTFLRLNDEDLQSMGMNKKWRQVLLAAAHDLRQTVLKDRIWGQDVSPLPSPGTASPAIPVDVFTNGFFNHSSPALLMYDSASESEGEGKAEGRPKRHRNGRVRGMVETYERSGSFSSESSVDGEDGRVLRRSRSSVGRWLRQESAENADEDPTRSPSPIGRALAAEALRHAEEPSVEELLAADAENGGSRGVRAWEEIDLAPGVTVKRAPDSDPMGEDTIVLTDAREGRNTVTAIDNNSGRVRSSKKIGEKRRVVTAIFSPTKGSFNLPTATTETNISGTSASPDSTESAVQTDDDEPTAESQMEARDAVLTEELEMTRILLDKFRARLAVVERKVADLEHREAERQMEHARALEELANKTAVDVAFTEEELSSDVIEIDSATVQDSESPAKSLLDKTHSLIPAALQHLNMMGGGAVEHRRPPRDEEGPSTFSDLPSYVLLVGLGVCAVVLRVMLKRMPGRGLIKP